MKINGYRNDIRQREIRKDSIDNPYPLEKRKSSFTKVLLIGLLLFFAGSLGYDYIKKNNVLEKINIGKTTLRKDVNVTEKTSVISTFDKENEIVTTTPDEMFTYPKQIKQGDAETIHSRTNASSAKEQTTTTTSRRENKSLSTIDMLDRINHAHVVKEAKRAGVSTEGSTTDILERITRKELERLGY